MKSIFSIVAIIGLCPFLAWGRGVSAENRVAQTTETVLEQFLADRAIPRYDVDSVQFFQSGADKFESLLRDMASAKHHIHCEYFIFANDSIGHRIIDMMKLKARQGVECRLLVDGYYDKKRGYRYDKRIKLLRNHGIEVCVYAPYEFPYAHRVLRDHRKIVVIDGRISYTGGFNVADYNIKGKPGIYGGYVDTHVRLEGQVVEGLQFLFANHFERSGGSRFEGNAYYPYTAAHYAHRRGSAEACIVERSHHIYPKKMEMRRTVVKLIDEARDSLHITSPYLLPIPSVRRAIRRAQKRGVHVEILFSEEGDTPLFDVGNLNYAHRLHRRGAEVWLYRGAFQHSKILTVDGRCSLVGSVNLDSRAMRWNEEVAALIFDEASAHWLDSTFVENQRKAHRLTDEYYENLPFSKRMKGFFANYFLSWCL